MHNASRILVIALTVALLPRLALAQTITLKNGARTEVVTREQLAAMPRARIAMTIHDAPHTFEGVPVTLLLQRVGAPVGEAVRGDALADVVMVRSRDGYAVALTLAETDVAMRKEAIILADRVDGAPIAEADGPYRLVVAGDLRPARSARMVESLEILSLKGR